MPAIGLSTHIWNNNLRSILLLALYPLIIMALVWGIAFVIGYGQTGTYIRITDAGYHTGAIDPAYFANRLVWEYWPAILTVIIIWFIIAYFFNTAMVRALSHARAVTRGQEPELYNLLENLCISRGLPMPKLNIIETHARNAFASGISQKTYTVTVTRGLMNSLQRDELEAVLGHELTHIINRDVRLLIVTVIFTGMIGFAAQLVWSNLRYTLIFSRRSNRNRGGGILVFMAIAAILWIGYMATLFTRFAISRRREYMADAGAIELTRNPEAMMRALMRIAGRDQLPQASADIQMMCIENGKAFMGLFATHPPIEDRIRAISAMTATPIPGLRHTGPAEKEARSEAYHSARQNPWLTRGRRL